MTTDDPHSEKRIGYRPKYLLLCVDGAGRDWLWRTTDDRIIAVDETERFRAVTLDADADPEAIVAHVADEYGIIRQYLAGTLADALATQLEVAD